MRICIPARRKIKIGKNALAYERCFSARKKIKIGKKCKSANVRLCKKARICESPHFCDAIKTLRF